MDNIILWIMAIAMVLGALDRMFGSRLGLGKQFEEGILAIGALSLSMLGILTLAPVLARLLRPVLVPVYGFLGADPAMFAGSILANDMGGAPLAMELAGTRAAGQLGGLIVGSMLGATVVFGETTEFLGGEHILANRAVGGPDGPVAKKIYEIVERMENRAKAIGEDMRGGQPTPGNIAGGLSSIEEKSLGAIVKSGHRPIQGVLEYTDRITDQKGLWIKDTPGREPEILTGMAATGAQVLMFSTGRGAPQGFCSMPVIKICGNPITYARMSHDMDLNAGRIITGEKTIEQVGEEAFEMLLKVLSGQMTKNEALSYFGSIDIYCLGPVI